MLCQNKLLENIVVLLNYSHLCLLWFGIALSTFADCLHDSLYLLFAFMSVMLLQEKKISMCRIVVTTSILHVSNGVFIIFRIIRI
jgi:hypothetical protein